MSIPPLVCSTPPPPEQVVCDDIGQDEFALPYDLSQDEDEEYCAYEDFHPALPTSPIDNDHDGNCSEKPNTYNSVSPEKPDIEDSNSEQVSDKDDTNLPSPGKNLKEEDNSIEDLDLKFDTLSMKTNVEIDARKDSSTNYDSPGTLSNTASNVESLVKQVDNDIRHITYFEKSPSQESITDKILQEDENIDTENGDIKHENIYESEYSPRIKELQNPESTANRFHTESSGIDLSGELPLEKEDDFNDFHFVPSQINLEQEVLGNLGFQQSTITTPTVQEDITTEKNFTTVAAVDDDFNDFDTFRINPSIHNVAENVLGSVNPDPWKNDVDPADNFGDFGSFQATFKDSQSAAVESASSVEESKPHSARSVNEDIEDENDFGDFDDFQSSRVSATASSGETAASEESGFSMNSFDFKNIDCEDQIYENIEKSLHSLYQEQECEETQEALECSLESSLCETWGYLTETEIRQPYMLNWNNSIGQQTLLKSLGIDSRNILFGPKWNIMRCYAAVLGAEPLRPMKPTSTNGAPVPAAHASSADSDKPKAIDTWADSTAGETQEFTYAEALLLDLEHLMATLDQMAHNQSSLKISELLSHACNDTDTINSVSAVRTDHPRAVFKEGMLKPSKVYSAALNLQPLRQINLPDTHIFTPTDSEVPRSKTIHYDNVAPITPHISHNLVHNHTEGILSSEKTKSDKHGPSQIDSEYDDFQEFQDNTGKNSTDSNALSHFTEALKTNKFCSVGGEVNNEVPALAGQPTYQTQTILEPVKLEASVPKLNWPDPGEVSETFDDFSDFVSNSSWSNFSSASSQNAVTQNVDVHKDTLTPQSENQTLSQIVYAGTALKTAESVDDFDNFQFAPVEPLRPKIETPSPSGNVKPIQTTPVLKNLPSNGLLHPMVPLKMQTTISTNPTSGSLGTVHPQILQPSSLDRLPQADKTNSQQILQPLSLESFSQINWPSPGVDLQDLSRFNPINAVHTLQHSSNAKQASPAHSNKSQPQEDDWGDFVSIKPTKSPQPAPKSPVDDDDWSDFVSSTSSKQTNGLNTISFNVHTNFSTQKPSASKRASQVDARVTIPNLNYITPKTNHRGTRDGHFQNL